ncbi:MAG: 2-amino-4-hydroxy-6-hydroxymethyldihydropteridine diphosphokinase [Sulfuricurvum sp.]|uniref:2-amino-4-hydroxy-6- hydroxymethyldihydropteridine diphosphokinase n=1 Tax=Sulfuricurvum sp. TaxID=2025608 RepID=UPI0026340365|nr:2-amino-4-hydroxy-6-hydroxymethyldihydropteridine diphosphokinase [Sulfuricurvum sp.]MDD2829226.1 2-amino-4-hydroxy-6-hydroxymethyldihydropteridine diphosphokinase [Sulfuricurvum sp.]MDD4949059.1 2-amino-4-hydroxy-6-hydroxymethyldihydropteridine diphosphokinase [Sulfuricurvum sp.]
MFLRRILDERHTIYVNNTFPTRRDSCHRPSHRAVLGVGGNIGDVKRRFHHLIIHLNRLSQLSVIQTGVILKNPPFGYNKQDDFYNTVIEISTTLSPRALLRLLWRIEKRFGRVRSFANAPRTLDLDMIFYDNRVLNYPELIIPHPHWDERLSVRIPLRSMTRKTFRRDYENLNI